MDLTDVTHLSVAATRDRYRRAVRPWGTTPETVPAADFTPEQIRALHDDPMIIVTPLSAHPTVAAGPAGSGPSAEGPAKAGHAERADRGARLLAAIARLPEGDEHRTTDGRPEVAALRTATGLADVSAAERDAWTQAWEAHLAPLLAPAD